MTGLSDADCADLDAIVMRDDWQSHELMAFVNRLIARERKSARDQALDEAASEMADLSDAGAGEVRIAYHHAWRVVRNLKST